MEEMQFGKNVSSGAEKVESIEKRIERERRAAAQRVEEARERLARKKGESENLEKSRADGESRVGVAPSGGRDGQNGNQKGNQNGGQGKDKKRGDGLGGWIAAVVSLGAATLALTAVVTVGAVQMRRDNAATAAAYRGTMYEFIGVLERVDDDLDTLRIAESAVKQSELLTDVLVQTRIAEADLEKLPFDGHSDENTMRFLNHASAVCERMLGKLAMGEKLNERDKAMIEELYAVNHKTRAILDELAATIEDKDVTSMMKGKNCRITEALENVENNVMPPVKMGREKKDGAKETSAKMQDRAGIPSKRAEELCRHYFADYGVQTLTYSGETLGRGWKAYNFDLRTEDDVRIFAQISQDDGALISFDYYEECSRHVYDVDTARDTAQAFLEKLGYEDMIPVTVDESGVNADFTFAYYANGCTYYPDQITIRVCEERGVVSGMDATKYLKNHRGRDELNAKITMQEARDKLSDKLTVESSRLVLFEHKGREMTAYEFFCSFDGELYFLYLDATSGDELFIVNSKDM